MDVTKDVLEILKWRLRFMVSLRATPPQNNRRFAQARHVLVPQDTAIADEPPSSSQTGCRYVSCYEFAR